MMILWVGLVVFHIWVNDEVALGERDAEVLRLLASNIDGDTPGKLLVLSRIRDLVPNARNKKEILLTLISVIDRDHSPGSFYAAAILRKMGSSAEPVLPNLIDILRKREHEKPSSRRCARAAAALAISGIGSKAKCAVPVLRELLTEDEPSIRAAAAETLGELGSVAVHASSDLLPLLKDEDAYVPVAAALALWKLDQASSESIPALKSAIRANRGDRKHALLVTVDAICEVGSRTKEARPVLLELLRDEDDTVRLKAAISLLQLFPEERPVLSVAEHFLLNKDEDRASVERCLQVASVLAKHQAYARTCIDLFSRHLQDDRTEVRLISVCQIAESTLPPEQKALLIAPALRDKESFVRQIAAARLGELGSAALRYLRILRQLQTEDRDPFVRWQANVAIRNTFLGK